MGSGTVSHLSLDVCNNVKQLQKCTRNDMTGKMNLIITIDHRRTLLSISTSYVIIFVNRHS